MYRVGKFLAVLVVCFVVAAAVTPVSAGGLVPTRIQFRPGATSAGRTGQLAAYGAAQYVLRASAGQVMEVSVVPDWLIDFEIYGADGTSLKRYGEGGSPWSGRLPRTQDYYIELMSDGNATWYSLRVTVFARIRFAAGATSATIWSPAEHSVPQAPELEGGYLLRAFRGQTMKVSVKSPYQGIYLEIVGANGAPLLTFDQWRTTWKGVLPKTQDYYLRLVGVGSDPSFTLSVWISPLP